MITKKKKKREFEKMRLAYVLAVVLLVAAPFFFGDFTLALLAFVGIQAIAVLGLVVLTGAAGLSSFGQAAFMGIGAYATAYYSAMLDGSPWIGLILALTASGVIALVLGACTLRLEGHFLPLSTVAWGIGLYYLFGSLAVLGGRTGITGVPPISLFGHQVVDARTTYYVVALVLVIALYGCSNLLDARPGRAIRSLKGGRVLVESLGISVFKVRLAAFVICGLLAGISGWLFAHTERFVSPSPFDLRPGVELVFMALVGGAASIWGAVLGSAVVIFLKNEIQDVLQYFGGRSTQFEAVIFGAAFVILLLRARNGLVPWISRCFDMPKRAIDLSASHLPKRTKPERGTQVLKLAGVTKRFGGLVAVNQISAEVNAGEILGVIGPNGAGKSTLFNLISGALPLTSGDINFLGHSINSTGAVAVAQSGMARTFQHVRLLPKMTVLENVALGAHLRTSTGLIAAAVGANRDAEAAVFREAYEQLVRVGLSERAHLRAESLSLGEQRVLEIARALISDPLLILLDEPAAGLRYLEKTALATLLRDLRAEGLSVLLVEHDMPFVMSVVDRIVVMDFGTKIAQGLPADIRRDVRVREAYLGVG